MVQSQNGSAPQTPSDTTARAIDEKTASNSADEIQTKSDRPQRSSGRSARAKAAGKASYNEDSDSEDVEVSSPPPSRQARSRQARKRQPVRGNWSADHLMQSDKSKLKEVDLEELLGHPKAWSVLSDAQQQQLCSMLPQNALPQEVLRTNPTFRSQLRLFQDELAAGRFDPVWLREAQRASERRSRGDFDKWKENEREKFWGQKQTTDWAANAGDTAKWSIQDLVKGGCFQIGDVWLIKQNVRTTEEVIKLEKEVTIAAIMPNNTLTFSYAPGCHKHSSLANGEDKELVGNSSPSALMRAMMAEDGRVNIDHRVSNAWRQIRCYRKNQDMGSLWDVREMFHNRQSA